MSPEILHGILLTVQRLESALDGLDERLRVLERSTARDLSRRDHQEPIPQRLGAADYQKSAQRLRQLYVFDSQSALSLPGANPALDTQNLHADIGGYCRPMSSVYSSRPLSRLDIDAFPAETQVCPDTPTSGRESSTTCPASSASSRISTRSADTHVTTPSSWGSTRRLSLDNALRVLKGGDGRLRGLWKSIPTRSLSQSHSDASSRVVSQETPTVTALCYDDMKALSQDDTEMEAKTDTKRQSVFGFGHELGRKATVVRRGVAVRVQKVAFSAGRTLMNQQLRMLDNRV